MSHQLPANLIIGLSGKPRSGKDTAAKMLMDCFPGIHFMGFSLAIKEAYDNLHGTNTLHDEAEKDRLRQELNAFSLPFLQKDPQHWVKIALAYDPPLLFKDVRLVPEADGIKEKGGFLIRIEIEHAVMKERWGEHYGEHHLAHDFENALDDYPNWDFVIHNNGHLDELREKIEEIAEQIRQRLGCG